MAQKRLPADGGPSDSSFAKGLQVLDWVLDHEGARANHISAGCGLPLSSTYRFLRTLREHRFITDADNGFGVGPRLGGRLSELPAARITALAHPFLERLAEVTGETAVLTMRRGLDAICVDQVESSQMIRLAFRIGQLLPLYAGAGQRALLAFAPDEVVRSVLARKMQSYTPSTPSRYEMRCLIERTRKEFFALSRGEIILGSIAVAVPVIQGDDAVCALCVAGVRNRCGSAWQRATRGELTKAAQSMAEVLAGGGD